MGLALASPHLSHSNVTQRVAAALTDDPASSGCPISFQADISLRAGQATGDAADVSACVDLVGLDGDTRGQWIRAGGRLDGARQRRRSGGQPQQSVQNES